MRSFFPAAGCVLVALTRILDAHFEHRTADVLSCPTCRGRMKLVAMRTLRQSITRSLAAIGELTHVPERSPCRGPPYWKSTVLCRKALGDAA